MQATPQPARPAGRIGADDPARGVRRRGRDDGRMGAMAEDYSDFFLASAGVAGALVGLLFVAITVRPEQLRERQDTQLHRVRAAATLTAFTNALAVSLFALAGQNMIGGAAVAVGIVGEVFVLASLSSVVRVRGVRWGDLHETGYMFGFVVLFGFQIYEGIRYRPHHENNGVYQALSILVIVCFLVGIARAWELVGGPTFGPGRELRSWFGPHRRDETEAEPPA
jgi:DMSO/TMAO reductase YedYZ heme-binding membrane subunit